ncbi:cobaltochelatase subunit CobN [Enterovirga sp.]|uniref:cobaltochelatase subunit CobN n=1 Tax=Enterovirga sp. TaxID=2026350 RepID=UPI002625ED21|nr:cobaltochelatase subunit CobN [Enterovirga sp.]MDB5589761.1 cobN [Enterovirga sp.]
MHLQVALPHEIDDGSAARDLEQPPADIVILSAADSELAAVAAALTGRDPTRPSVALTNLLRLGHPMSVDLYVERTLATARFIVLRLVGGEGYWPHGIDSLRRWARRRRIPFACLPGDTRWDPAFAAGGTLPETESRALWRYFAEGGAENMQGALAFIEHALGSAAAPPPARPIPSAGLWPEPRPGGDRPRAAILFYRALAQGGMTEPVEALAAALEDRGLSAQPIFVTSLKDESSARLVASAFAAAPPDVILNATAFAVGTVGAAGGSVLDAADCPILQVAFAGSEEAEWRASTRGLSPRDLAMNVVMPEVDGRIFAGAVAFKQRRLGLLTNRSVPEQVAAAADLAASWVRLRRTPAAERRVGLVVANYPNRDGRLGNGVGLDTPESCAVLLAALRASGYALGAAPSDAAALMALLGAGPTNAIPGRADRSGGETLAVAAYRALYAGLPEATRAAVDGRWGEPDGDPFVADGAFRLGLHRFGHVAIGIQPARGYNIDPKDTYHAPDLAPPHHYLAFYLWLRESFGAHAVLHVGKHGNLEWLPGKSVGLSAACLPQAVLGPVPNIYPFIVNDPGEGMQAKRRTGAVIVDHLTPPLARAELHGELVELEQLVDEYAVAADLDPRRAEGLAKDIAASAGALRLDADLDLRPGTEPGEALRRIDAHLCDLKEMQIRDGLHVLGRSPEPKLREPLLVAIARLPRSELRPDDASLHRALATDLGLDGFDPLTRDLAAPYAGPRPAALLAVSDEPWRHAGDTVERIELLAEALVAGRTTPDPAWPRSRAVLGWIDRSLRPAVESCGRAEIGAVLAALDGRFVPPGPAGAPTRGRPDVLPTGRNFFAVDTRAVPSAAAWRTGRAAAERLLERYWQEAGEWPRSVALSCWGTANMRTGGDDIAQALALIGARPVWEPGSGRVTGFQVMGPEELLRPRVDVTLRVSGLFRDAFPTQIDLFDSAVRAIAALDEPDEDNPIAAHVRAEARRLGAGSTPIEAVARRAAARVFGAKPGAYGAGLQALIDEGGWEARSDLAQAYRAWSGYAYGGGQEGDEAGDLLTSALGRADAVVQAQDNREHDILDSDDYYQFMGGLSAAVEEIRGAPPRVFHLDTSRPEAPLARTLGEEIARVVRGRAANPKWLAGVMRHGYKGAFEIAATVDYLFGFAASTDAVKDHHFDQLFAAYLEDEAVRAFMAEANPAALRETAERFAEAMRRGLWQPRSNRTTILLAELSGATREGEKA